MAARKARPPSTPPITPRPGTNIIVPRPSAPPSWQTQLSPADKKLYDSMVQNFGGDFKGLGDNVRTASGNANLTDDQALRQKFENARTAQKSSLGAKPVVGAPVPGKPAPVTTTPSAPAPIKPTPTPAPTPTPTPTPTARVDGGGGGGGPIAATPAMSPSMAGLQAGGGGGEMGGSMQQLSGPSRFRQGIGTRIPPQMSQSLAALRGRIY